MQSNQGQLWGASNSYSQQLTSRPGPGPASFAQAVNSAPVIGGGGGGGGGAIGVNGFSTNGFGNNSTSPQPASLDLSDFPALGSVGSHIQQQQHDIPQNSSLFSRSSTNPSPAPDNKLNLMNRAPVPLGLPSRIGSQQPAGKEEFPALPGMIKAPTAATAATAAATTASILSNTSSSNLPSQSQSAIGSQSDMDKYGMNGLLSVIRMENNDQTTVAIGNDLTALGLDFSSAVEPLSKTFASPWPETSKYKVVPEFKLPSCYDVPSAPPQQQKIQNLTEETLFYIFYTMPRDSMQEAAAVELTNRNWRYHKELKLWLTKDPLSEPVQQTAQAERGIYIFFDPSTWEKVKVSEKIKL